MPDLAVFPLVYDNDGRAATRRYFESFLDVADPPRPAVSDRHTDMAREQRPGDRVTGWASHPPTSPQPMRMQCVSREVADGRSSVLVDGILGPRGNGYVVSNRMNVDQATAHHSAQIRAMQGATVDRVTALALGYPEEAIGIVRASMAAGVPVVASFTVEVDGRLPTERLSATRSVRSAMSTTRRRCIT